VLGCWRPKIRANLVKTREEKKEYRSGKRILAKCA
jgi:hypothetical protein